MRAQRPPSRMTQQAPRTPRIRHSPPVDELHEQTQPLMAAPVLAPARPTQRPASPPQRPPIAPQGTRPQRITQMPPQNGAPQAAAPAADSRPNRNSNAPDNLATGTVTGVAPPQFDEESQAKFERSQALIEKKKFGT